MSKRKRKDLRERLYNNLYFSPDGCWYWTGATDQNGYGKMCMPGNKFLSSHRVSFELHVEPIEPGKHILHACDNPLCCNPHHLSQGTASDNKQDMLRKGRGNFAFGPRNGRTIILESTVLEIRKLRGKYTQPEIAKMFDIKVHHVSDIQNFRSWKHLRS